MKIDYIEAVNRNGNPKALKVFLAGGIQKCYEWQKDVVSNLSKYNVDRNVELWNPRRENFPIHDPNASEEQITWEFEAIEKCDIFTMYFDNTESAQPICFYELGRNIERMKQKFPDDWESRIIISCDSRFSRKEDVIIQTKLATNDKIKVSLDNDTNRLIEIHSDNIRKSICNQNIIIS